MRILVINPNTTQAMTDEIAQVARAAAATGTEIDCVSPESGPRSIEGYTDEVLAAYHTVDLVAQTKGRYDGYVIACFGDPAIAACREISDVPVVGIAEAAFHMASLVAYKWSIVTVLPRVKPFMEEVVHRNGMEHKCASIRCTPLTVLEIEADIEQNEDWIAHAMLDADMRAAAGLKVPSNDYKGAPLYIFTKANVAKAGTPPDPAKGYGNAYRQGFAKLWRVG